MHRGFTFIAWLDFPQAYTGGYTVFLVKPPHRHLLVLFLLKSFADFIVFSVWLFNFDLPGDNIYLYTGQFKAALVLFLFGFLGGKQK